MPVYQVIGKFCSAGTCAASSDIGHTYFSLILYGNKACVWCQECDNRALGGFVMALGLYFHNPSI